MATSLVFFGLTFSLACGFPCLQLAATGTDEVDRRHMRGFGVASLAWLAIAAIGVIAWTLGW